MSRNNIVEDDDLEINEGDYQDDVSANFEKEIGSEEHAKIRQRIDELLEKKRLKELLDEDEWEL